MELKKSIVLVFASLAFLQQFAAIVLASSESSCKFQSSPPTNINRTIGHSKDNQALVVASGYLRYYSRDENPQNFRYMPLEFKSFNFEPSYDSYELILNADCAQIFLDLVKSGQGWKVDEVDVILEIGNRGAFICSIDDANMAQESGKHYGCDLGNNPFVCTSDVGLPPELVKIVDVVFDRLEFEIFGSTEKTKINQFTTNTTTC